MEPETDDWIPQRSAGWYDETGITPRIDPEPAQRPLPNLPADISAAYPQVRGKVAYLDVPEGTVGVAALAKVANDGGSAWELQTVGIDDYELLGALRVQLAKLEQRLTEQR